MALTDNERIQEFVLVVGDKISLVGKKWWYALLITLVLLAPIYYLAKAGFVGAALRAYRSPQIIYSTQTKQALQIKDKGIFSLGGGGYSGFVKISNIELDWGVASQPYTAEFKTFGGTVVAKVSGTTFILPSSEKLIVFSRFTADKKPDEMVVTLGDTHFVQNPGLQFNFSLERNELQNSAGGLTVSAAIKNETPFTVSQVSLPVTVFDNQGHIVAVNFTSINDLLSNETRSFSYSWTQSVSGAIRAEIKPEINVFDRNVFQVTPGVSPFSQ